MQVVLFAKDYIYVVICIVGSEISSLQKEL